MRTLHHCQPWPWLSLVPEHPLSEHPQVFDGAVIILSLAPMVASTVANGPKSPWDAISLIIMLRIWRVKRVIDGEWSGGLWDGRRWGSHHQGRLSKALHEESQARPGLSSLCSHSDSRLFFSFAKSYPVYMAVWLRASHLVPSPCLNPTLNDSSCGPSIPHRARSVGARQAGGTGLSPGAALHLVLHPHPTLRTWALFLPDVLSLSSDSGSWYWRVLGSSYIWRIIYPSPLV